MKVQSFSTPLPYNAPANHDRTPSPFHFSSPGFPIFAIQFPEGGALFKPFFAQAAKETAASLVYYLSKMFPYRPSRWLDRVLVSVFLGPSSISHADIGKRRCVCVCVRGVVHAPKVRK